MARAIGVVLRRARRARAGGLLLVAGAGLELPLLDGASFGGSVLGAAAAAAATSARLAAADHPAAASLDLRPQVLHGAGRTVPASVDERVSGGLPRDVAGPLTSAAVRDPSGAGRSLRGVRPGAGVAIAGAGEPLARRPETAPVRAAVSRIARRGDSPTVPPGAVVVASASRP